MKITFFTGAGVSKESGINTFRDADGLWNQKNLKQLASAQTWTTNPELMLEFYNERRAELSTVKPNSAHQLIAQLQENHDVTVITQNVDNLHERAGSENVIHLHGELTKARPENSSTTIIDIGEDPIAMGDTDSNGNQLRPHIVWFGEYPLEIDEAVSHLKDCDVLIIVGTSLQIGYTLNLLELAVNNQAAVYYLDPDPSKYLEGITEVEYLKEPATSGMEKIYEMFSK